jgi:tripartite-type tricarboxylate transporter receptor subunit TctC
MRFLASTLASACLICASLFAPSALAQATWPSKPVRIVNNFPAGGPSDILARALADGLQKSSGQAVIVENKPGAGGNIGAAEVAKAAGDGGTVLCGIDTAFTVNPHIFPTMTFKLGNKAGDLKPLMIISSNGLMLGTSAAKLSLIHI